MVVRIASIVSVVWIFVLSVYAALSPHLFKRMFPNEVGDFLAGSFAPLAAVWIGVTVWLQYQQLMAQTEALRQSSKTLALQSQQVHDSITMMKQNDLKQQLDRLYERMLLGALRVVKMGEDEIILRSDEGGSSKSSVAFGAYKIYSDLFRGRETETIVTRFAEGLTVITGMVQSAWVLDISAETLEELCGEFTSLDRISADIERLTTEVQQLGANADLVPLDVIGAFRKAVLAADTFLDGLVNSNDEN